MPGLMTCYLDGPVSGELVGEKCRQCGFVDKGPGAQLAHFSSEKNPIGFQEDPQRNRILPR